MQETSALKISLLVLTLNEAENLAFLIAAMRQQFENFSLSYEIIVIDGASTDGSADVASKYGAICYQQESPGYGGALRDAFAKARGEYVLTMDADLSHPPELFPSIWRVHNEADIVIASRLVSGGSSEASLWRKFLSVLLNRVVTTVLSIPFSDISSGYRLYRRALLVPQTYKANNFDILQEIAVKAFADGYKIIEVPLKYQRRQKGTSHASLTRFVQSFVSTCFRMWKLRNSIEAADYDDRAFDSRIPIQRYWQRKRFQIIKAYLKAGKRTLDVGCGSSRIIQSLPEAVAFDISFKKLRFLKASNELRVCASTFALPFSDCAFEQLIHSQLIEHVPFDKCIFTELNRILELQGTLVIGTPDYGRIWWPIIEFFYDYILPNAYGQGHITHYTAAKLRGLLSIHGFEELEHRYICGGELIVKARKVSNLN